jgi:DNA-binding CsgD family transcriptional regulator
MMQAFSDQMYSTFNANGSLSLFPTEEAEMLLRMILQAFNPDLEQSGDGACLAQMEVCVDNQLYRLRIYGIDPVIRSSRAALSPRELEIARLIARGMPNKQIAHCLGLSDSTVGTYTKRIYLKLNVGSRALMVSKMMSEGLLD